MKWTANLAYAVGLITTDGCLSKDGRHIDLTSKDIEQIENFKRALNIKNKISTKKSTYNPLGTYYRVQFGDIKFYNFLLKIGLSPHKSKTLGSIKIPGKYLADFLRGHLDGDGYTTSYMSNQYKNSFVFYTYFISSSQNHINYLRDVISKTYKINGCVNYQKQNSIYRLAFAKINSKILLNYIYYNNDVICLGRKRDKNFRHA